VYTEKALHLYLLHAKGCKHSRLRLNSYCILTSTYNAQWPSGLGHELFSPAPTLRSWVRIPHRHGYLCVFWVRFFCFYIVSNETASRPNKRLMRTYHWISLFNVIWTVSKLAYRIWVILIANKRVIKKTYNAEQNLHTERFVGRAARFLPP
jgi:hypothetical protein